MFTLIQQRTGPMHKCYLKALSIVMIIYISLVTDKWVREIGEMILTRGNQSKGKAIPVQALRVPGG
jgi:hypothetical protein